MRPARAARYLGEVAWFYRDPSYLWFTQHLAYHELPFEAFTAGKPPEPPQEAFDACKSLAEGADCNVAMPAKTLEGACRKGPEGEGSIACAPASRNSAVSSKVRMMAYFFLTSRAALWPGTPGKSAAAAPRP